MKTSSTVLVLTALLISFASRQAYSQSLKTGSPQPPFRATSWQVGIKPGYGRGNILSNRTSIQLQGGYFVMDKLSLGLNATWTREWVDDFSFHDLTAGPYARYQFTQTWFSPFVEASYQIGRRRAADGSSVSYPSIAVQSLYTNPGISFRLLDPLRLELSYAFQWVFFSGNANLQFIGQPQLGLTYLFP